MYNRLENKSFRPKHMFLRLAAVALLSLGTLFPSKYAFSEDIPQPIPIEEPQGGVVPHQYIITFPDGHLMAASTEEISQRLASIGVVLLRSYPL